VLTIVPTPIGNLGDITLRAVEALRAADLVVAEDTRHSGLLLQHLGIKKPFLSLHGHNEASRVDEVVRRLRDGMEIALVTDAGMPSVSDPGRRLIDACIGGELPMTVLPGPSATITALVGSGLDAAAFHFGGFLPVKSGQRLRELGAAASREATSLYFESPHRLVKSLAVLAEVCPGRRVCVARELTKRHEEYRRGMPAGLLEHYMAKPPKGEITLVIEGTGRGGKRP
jgi:16S rRNA (cytidine1402-2'-O)-methyltransferase